MKPELLIDLLSRALTEELGLVVGTNNPHALTMKLHEIRKANPIFDNLELTVPSTPNTVMVVKKTVELNDLTLGDYDV